MQYKASHSDDTVTIRLDNVTADFKQSFLLLSDVHWDNPHCDRSLLRRLLDEAKNTDSGIFMVGDTFCAMQGKGDKRGNKSSIRPEHTTGNYFDALVNTAANYFQPYHENIVMISYGNHETAIIQHNESDIVQRLCEKLAVIRGGYGGFVQFKFSRGENAGSRVTKTMYYHHGHGGGGEATKGVPMAMRRAVYVPDADICISGHLHEQWLLRLPRVRVSASGKTYFDEQLHLQLPTFKQEHDLKGGYHVEKGRPPKPLGGWWLDFSADHREHGRIRIDARIAR